MTNNFYDSYDWNKPEQPNEAVETNTESAATEPTPVYHAPTTPFNDTTSSAPYANAAYEQPMQQPTPSYTAPSNSEPAPAYTPPIPPQEEPVTPKKEKKPKKSHTGVWLALVAVLSLTLGAVGGIFGPKWVNDLGWFNASEEESTIEESSREEVELQIGGKQTSPTIITNVAASTADSVVEITTESVTTGNYFSQQILTGAGSGVVITEDGYIITNNHVIEGANKITVKMHNGEEYAARLVGTDAKTDIAVIKVEAKGLKPATFGSSADLQVGETAIVVGNPLGSLGGSVTVGVISALDREITVEGHNMTLLQTDASVNPGNSGGGLFNVNGELVGIINAKSGGEYVEGIGFAIPSDTARKIAEELIEKGYISGRAAMGVNVIEVTDAQTAQAYGLNSLGVYIVSVNEGSGAEKAGLQVGDRIVAIGNNAINTLSDVSSALDEYNVGDTVEVIIVRENRTGTARVKLQEMEQIPATDAMTEEEASRYEKENRD